MLHKQEHNERRKNTVDLWRGFNKMPWIEIFKGVQLPVSPDSSEIPASNLAM